MKQLVFILFITFLMNAYAENEGANPCDSNGYPLREVINVGKTIQEALKTNNMPLLAEQFLYPFAVNLPQGKRIISSKQELIDNFSLIYSKADIEQMIAEKDLNAFCRYDGAAIFGGIWLSTDENEQIKVFVINAPDDTKLSPDKYSGDKMTPLNDLKLLNEFADRYNNSGDNVKMVWDKLLYVVTDLDGSHLTDGPVDVYGHSAFLLYQIDINNDNELEWVLASLDTFNFIGAVYKNKGTVLENLHFDDVITSNFQLADMSRWYMNLNTPLFTRYKTKIACNFYNTRPAQVCSYVWQNNKVTLVQGDQSYCIH